MEILYTMVISAVAVLATLIYASYLDIKDRRVPFVTWLPMLIVGISCTSFLLWQTTAKASLVFGYLALVASFLYADYLDNLGRTDSPGLIWYYRKSAIFYYLSAVIALPALSWFVFAPSLNVQIVPWFAMFAGIFCYVTYVEYSDKPATKKKQKKAAMESNIEEALTWWYFVLIIVILAITSVLMMFSGGWGSSGLLFVLLPAVFCGAFYIFGRMHFFGGADAWALIFLAIAVPAYPFIPLLNLPPIGFLAFSVLLNALILNLVAPVGIFLINIVKRNRAPLMYMFFGFPVDGDKIQDSWGFVMEEFYEKKGVVSRRFIGFWDSVGRMYAGEGRIYTKDLREHPEDYAKELATYRKAGTVWISYAVPFIIPITAGFISAMVFGDFLFGIMRFLLGSA
jgi:preflagellin peptidase FlaK